MNLEVEEPMRMSYREAYAWQLGWGIGFKAGVEHASRKKAEAKKEVSNS